MRSGRIVLFNPLGFEYPEEKLLKKGLTHLAGLPLSVLSVSVLVEKYGYDVKIISGSEKDYINKIKKTVNKETIIFGISSMTGYQITQGLKIAAVVREINPSVTIAWGGFHPSIMPDQTAEADLVDVVIRGYGEKTLLELADAVSEGKDFKNINGITYLDNGTLISTPDRELDDLDNFPPLPYHLIKVEDFLTPELGEKTIAYMTSRGCPNSCSFCSDKVIYKRKWNAYSVDRVLDDFQFLKNMYGIDSVRIMDSNFFVNEKRVADFCRGMIDRELNIKWGRVNGSAEILVRYSEETWQLLKDAGCHSIAVGIESGYDKALRKINKPASLDNVYLLKDILNKYGINLLGAFMLGIPLAYEDYAKQRGEFCKEVGKTIHLINDLMKNKREDDRVQLFKCTPYPGTELFNECCKYGWNMPERFEDWQRNTLFNSDMTWLTEDEVSLIDSLIVLLQQAYPAKAKGK